MLRLSFLLLSVLALACTEPPAPPTYRYVHLAHTRTDDNPYLDSLVEATDWTVFDQLWLGGDLIPNTTRRPEYLVRIDSFLPLSRPTTHLAVGNHDAENRELLSATTGRPSFYFEEVRDLGILVLDTEDSLSNMRGEQLDFVRRTLTGLPPLSHLIVLHHKLIWLDDDGPLRDRVNDIANGGYGDCWSCLNPNNFYRDVYPLLVEVEQRGTEVLCLGGDVGFKVRTFHHRTDEGIDFLASGLDFRAADKPVILFEHRPAAGELEWSFVQIAQLGE